MRQIFRLLPAQRRDSRGRGGVDVTLGAGPPLKLFRRHEAEGSGHGAAAGFAQPMLDGAKVDDGKAAVGAAEHVGRLDVAMDQRW